jgi:hypothetical protein
MSDRSVPYYMSACLSLALLGAVGCSPSGEATPSTGEASATIFSSNPADWDITPSGFGPLTAGMTVAEASAAAGGNLSLASGAAPACSYAEWTGAPEGVRVMVVQDTVVRVEVLAKGISTAEGARIGDNEGRIVSLYGGRMALRPHKYTTGKYMIASPAAGADTLHRIVFETDGEEVLQFRAGRLPEVEWVEGCS